MSTSQDDRRSQIRPLRQMYQEQQNVPQAASKRASSNKDAVAISPQQEVSRQSVSRSEAGPSNRVMSEKGNQEYASWRASRRLSNKHSTLRLVEEDKPLPPLPPPSMSSLLLERSERKSKVGSHEIVLEKMPEPLQLQSYDVGPKTDLSAGTETHGILSSLANKFLSLYDGHQVETESIEQNDDMISYPQGLTLFSILLSGALPYVVVVLDDTVVAIIIPILVEQFEHPADIGWFATAYFLPLTVLMPLYGKCYALWKVKWLFLMALSIMITGSIVTASAISADMFIVGRAIAGAGAAGIITGAMRIIALSAPRKYRTYLEAAGAVVMGASTVSGPILGGIIADSIGWQWSFWINVPIATLSALIILTCFPKDEPTYSSLLGLPFREKLRRLDLIGAFLLISGLVCLSTLFESLSTSTYLTTSGIALSIASGILLAAFIVHTRFISSEVSIAPRKILLIPAVWTCCLGLFFLFAGFINFIFFLAIFFQSVDGQTPLESAVSLLPYALSVSVGAVITGLGVSKVRYYNPFFILGGLLFAVGAELIHTFDAETGVGTRIGYEVTLGLGVGFLMLGNVSACQTTLPEEDHSVAQGLTLFCSLLGSTVSVPVSSTIFNRILITRILALDLPATLQVAVLADPTKVHEFVPADDLPVIVEALVLTLREAFVFGLSCSIVSAVAFFLVPWTPLMVGQTLDEEGSRTGPTPKLPPVCFTPTRDLEIRLSLIGTDSLRGGSTRGGSTRGGSTRGRAPV